MWPSSSDARPTGLVLEGCKYGGFAVHDGIYPLKHGALSFHYFVLYSNTNISFTYAIYCLVGERAPPFKGPPNELLSSEQDTKVICYRVGTHPHSYLYSGHVSSSFNFFN